MIPKEVEKAVREYAKIENIIGTWYHIPNSNYWFVLPHEIYKAIQVEEERTAFYYFRPKTLLKMKKQSTMR